MTQLPSAKQLFENFFLIEYSARDRDRLGLEYPKADIMGSLELIGKKPGDISIVTTQSQTDIGEIVQGLLDHAEATWPGAFGQEIAFSLPGVAAFDKANDALAVSTLIKRSDPLNANNDYVIRASLFGAVIGETIRHLVPRTQWVYDHPLWESAIFDPAGGAIIPAFHWAIHRLSGSGIQDETTGKITAAVDMLNRIATATQTAQNSQLTKAADPKKPNKK
jgi:hypothetical protein